MVKTIIGGCTLWARKTINSTIFSEKPAVWFKIWFYIVSRVNHKDNAQFKRGQCHLSYENIILNCGATKAQIDHCIRWLKSCRMLATQKATRGFIITVCNYGLYQDLKNYKSDSTGDSKATQKRHYKQICKNVKNKDTSSKHKKPVGFVPPTIVQVQEYAAKQSSPDFDAKFFVDWYAADEWHHKDGNPVKSWKQTVLSWLRKEKKNKKPELKRGDPDWLPTEEEAIALLQGK